MTCQLGHESIGDPGRPVGEARGMVAAGTDAFVASVPFAGSCSHSFGTKKEDAFGEADWMQLPRLVSLSDLGVNDFRYSLYRSKVQLTAGQAAKERFLVI